MFKYFDAHTHIQFAAFSEDWEVVAKRALDGGVSFINVGTQKDTSAQAIEFAHRFPEGVYAAVGLHPVHTNKSYHDTKELGGGDAAKAFTSRGEIFDYDYYLKLARDPKVVAIGECGLDYYREEENDEVKIRQKDAFMEQLKLSEAVGKPIMIHCRNAFPDLLDLLEKEANRFNSFGAVLHFYTGNVEATKRLLALGCYFTFGGVTTFARDYDEVIKLIPVNRILSETDAPYVAPMPYRGKRNEPVYVIETVKKLAELKGVSEEKMAEQIYANAKELFGIK